jgi:predicted phosphodiesterase
MDKDIQILVIPDVHGRHFWKGPVKETLENTDAKIVFLGDYLDVYIREFVKIYNFKLEVYTQENMEKIYKLWDDTVEMFKEIVELKKAYPDRITLLLGNHDCTYAISTTICDVRCDRRNIKRIRGIFVENNDCFKLADEAYINDKHFIFSHAGINKTYAYQCFGDEVNEENVVDLFNTYYKEGNYGIIDSLGKYSYFRGWGGGDFGSLVWADAREWFQTQEDSEEKNEAYGIAVVGHTHISHPKFIENIAFLDTADAYYINSDGDIKKYYSDETIKNEDYE